MDTARYVIAVVLLVTFPPAVLHWLAVHPFAAQWRKLGAANAYLILGPAMIGIGVLLFLVRRPLIGADLGTNWTLVAIGALCYAASIVLESRIRRHLTFKTFAGVPELSSKNEPGVLLQEGVYGRVRHPRYVAVVFATLGFGLAANHVGTYVLFVLMIPFLLLITLLEERELAHRFGEAYTAYCARVPRFVPRRRRALPRT